MKAAFFDLDGTLTDPAEGITRCIQHALAYLGAPVPDQKNLHYCIGPSLRQSFTSMLNGDAEKAEQALTVYRERFSTLGMYENEIYPGIPDVLTTLTESGYALYVATSKPRVYAERILEHFHLASFFRRVFGPELNGPHLDKADLLGLALAEEPISAPTCWMVGDRRFDIEGARAHGIRSIGVLYGYGSREELTEAQADHLADKPEDLLTIIRKEMNPA